MNLQCLLELDGAQIVLAPAWCVIFYTVSINELAFLAIPSGCG